MIAIRGLAAIAVLGTAALAFHAHMTVGAGTPVLAAADGANGPDQRARDWPPR